MRRGRCMVDGGAGVHDESHRIESPRTVQVYDRARTHTHLYSVKRISRNGRVQWGDLIYYNDTINV